MSSFAKPQAQLGKLTSSPGVSLKRAERTPKQAARLVYNVMADRKQSTQATLKNGADSRVVSRLVEQLSALDLSVLSNRKLLIPEKVHYVRQTIGDDEVVNVAADIISACKGASDRTNASLQSLVLESPKYSPSSSPEKDPLDDA